MVVLTFFMHHTLPSPVRSALGLLLFGFAALAALTPALSAQVSYAGGSYTQNFDTLPSTGTFTLTGAGPFTLTASPFNASGMTGWTFAKYSGTGANALFRVDDGTANSGSLYSYGTTSASDRALGVVASGSTVSRFGLTLTNNTGQTITSFTLSYTGEQWRDGGNATPAAQTLPFDYAVGATDINTGTFTSVSALNFTSPTFTTTAGAINGNATANRTAISATVTGLSWGSGQTLTLRWTDANDSGNDHALAIDDLTFSTSAVTVLPAVSSVTPANGAVNIATNAAITLTFNEAVTVSGTWFTLTGSTTGAHTATVTGGPTTYTLTPDVAFAEGETLTLTVSAAQVADQATGTQHPTANFSSNFITSSSGPLAIHTVQGSGTASAYAGQIVTVQGIVIAAFQGTGQIGGYYLEAADADQDADATTSEGVYVFDSTNTVAVGDAVTVTGTVTEYTSSGVTETEISTVTGFTRSSTGNALPSAVSVSLPFANSAYAERYEGMRITLPQTLTVTDNYDLGHFGEVILSNGRLSTPTNIAAPGSAAQAQAAANLLNQVILDDGISTTYPDPTPFIGGSTDATKTRRTGSTTSNVAGVLAHKFGSYVVEPTATPTFTDANPRAAAPSSLGTLRVAIGNVENLMNGDGAGSGFPTSRGATTYAEYQLQLPKVVAGILGVAPDIMGLTEVENDRISNSLSNSYGSTSMISQLVAALNAAAPAGTTYAFVDASAVDIVTDVIHCAFIYRTQTVEMVGSPAMLNHAAFNSLARNPLAQTFRQISTGEKLTVCINHFRAKGSAASGTGNTDSGDGQGTNNALRVQEANALTTWLATDPTGSGDPDFLIIGDLNAYAKEDPITAIVGAGFTNLTERFEGAGGYSYAFNGEFGHLDHALATAHLNNQVVSAATWHVNSDEPVYYDYNVENKSTAQQAINAGTPYRYADHDPVVIGLNLQPDLTPQQTWRQTNFGTTANSGTAADTADPDGDGVVNTLEYALGLNPNSAASATLPTGAIESGNFVFRFTRPTSTTDLTYTVQTSTNLLNWSTASTSIESSTANTQTLIATLVPSLTKQFVRLSVGGATTVPVGYLNVTLAGSGATTTFGVPFDDPTGPASGLRAAKVEALTATTLTNSSGGWSPGVLAASAAPWAVRITSGAAAGLFAEVSGNTATTLTLKNVNLTTAGVTAGDTFELVSLDTLGTFFGASTLTGGTASATADLVKLYGSAWVSYYYSTSLNYWRLAAGPTTDYSNLVLRPSTGLQVTRRGTSLTLPLVGRVLGTKFRAPVANAGSTLLNLAYPMDTTLGGLAVQTRISGWRSGTTSAADQVYLYNGSAWIGYVFNGATWQTLSGGAASDSVAIAAGSALLVTRPGSTSGTTDFIQNLPY